MHQALDYAHLPFDFESHLPGPAIAVPGDRQDGAVYVHAHDPGLRLAMEIALVTGRPLLLRGPPGCGKSTFAMAAARRLGWRYYRQTVTSRTEARDLLYRFDAIARLADAQAGLRKPEKKYVDPGPLWWALDPEDARRYSGGRRAGEQARSGPDLNPDSPAERRQRIRDGLPSDGAVVLVDEMDKAESDLPNDLLDALGAWQFQIDELDRTVQLGSVRSEDAGLARLLVVITTNDERDLPPAFVRRCVVHQLVTPPVDVLVEVAQLHYSEDPPAPDLCRAIAKRLEGLGGRAGVSTAEYLDAVRACHALGVMPGDGAAWAHIERLTLAKSRV